MKKKRGEEILWRAIINSENRKLKAYYPFKMIIFATK